MPRQKTKDLKSQYLFRVYLDEENELLHRAIEKFKDKFDSTNDMIKYFALMGADKMLGDNMISQSINFSEIRKYLSEINDKLSKIKGEQKLNFVELQTENLLNQSLINLNNNLLEKITDIDLNNYSSDWKYKPYNSYEVNNLKNQIYKDILDERE